MKNDDVITGHHNRSVYTAIYIHGEVRIKMGHIPGDIAKVCIQYMNDSKQNYPVTRIILLNQSYF